MCIKRTMDWGLIEMQCFVFAPLLSLDILVVAICRAPGCLAPINFLSPRFIVLILLYHHLQLRLVILHPSLCQVFHPLLQIHILNQAHVLHLLLSLSSKLGLIKRILNFVWGQHDISKLQRANKGVQLISTRLPIVECTHQDYPSSLRRLTLVNKVSYTVG